jgi:hypothetical protein
MADLTERAQRDATKMKIIAAATFIYLPATFVSVSPYLALLPLPRPSLLSRKSLPKLRGNPVF